MAEEYMAEVDTYLNRLFKEQHFKTKIKFVGVEL